MRIMWFLLGLVCGGTVGALAGWYGARKFGPHSLPPTDKERVEPSKGWAETRNFLYYDGTVMPEIKENANEQ